jgi:hypothetical protein
MPLIRHGKEKDTLDTSKRNMRRLPWADDAALAHFRESLPSDEEFAKVDKFQMTPPECLEKPYYRTRMLENELGQALRTWMDAIEGVVDPETAVKIAYHAGVAHGSRRLSTFYKGIGSMGGVETMARWQDTSHSSAGPRHSSALFAHYDDELVEVVRTEDSFKMHSGVESPLAKAFMDGLIDGYHKVDPALTKVEEFVRDRPDGGIEFVHRFWYSQK